jgi:hypothetical protein
MFFGGGVSTLLRDIREDSCPISIEKGAQRDSLRAHSTLLNDFPAYENYSIHSALVMMRG